MPAKSSARPPRATTEARKRCEQNGRAIDRLAKSLEAAQAELTALRSTMGSGAGDLRKDLARLLRDARRDVGKLGKTVRRDLERIQNDLVSATSKSSSRTRRAARAGSRSAGTRGSGTRGGSTRSASARSAGPRSGASRGSGTRSGASRSGRSTRRATSKS
jgi:hypothetical protein